MILVTGTSGFIGKHLLSALITQYGADNILALTSVPTDMCPYILHENYRFKDDVFESTGFGGRIDTIILAGAFTPKSGQYANDWRMCNGNIFTVDRLLHVTFPRLKKLVYLSTLDVYDSSDLISEQSDIRPSTLYGESKFYCERLVSYYAQSMSLICHILRIGHVYGPGEESYQKLIPATIDCLLRDQPIQMWGDGSSRRAFIFIEDVIFAIMNSLAIDSSISPINVVGGNSLSIREVVEKLITISKKNCTIQYLTQKQDNRNLAFDNSKMLTYLLKTETPIDLGLQKEWDYMKKSFDEHLF